MVALLTSVTLFQLKVEWIFDLKSIFLDSTETSVEGMVVKFLSHPPPSLRGLEVFRQSDGL